MQIKNFLEFSVGESACTKHLRYKTSLMTRYAKFKSRNQSLTGKEWLTYEWALNACRIYLFFPDVLPKHESFVIAN